MSKEVFVAKLEGKKYGGTLQDFNPETLQGDNIFYSVKGYVALRFCKFIVPRNIIEYMDSELLITTENYYNIEGNGRKKK